MTDTSNQTQVDDKLVSVAKNVFRYLAEVKALQSPTIRTYKEYETLIWLNDIPREDGCYCKVWELLGEPAEDDGSDAWIRVKKPQLISPPELPDGIDLFVNLVEWRNSSLDQPSLKEVSREQLLRHFLPDEDQDPDVEQLQINENEDVFEEYVRYVDEEWQPWASAQREEPDSDIPYPDPPQIVIPWLDLELLGNSELDEPPINDEISVEIDTKFEEAKQILVKSWTSYLEAEWRPWAEQDRKLQKVQEIYNKLYSTYQSYQRLGEQYEVVMAFGLLAWNAAKSGRVRRHILVCDASLSFDAVHGLVSVSGNPNGLQLRPEVDMLEPIERPQQREMELIERQVADMQDMLWDKAFLTDLPNAFVNAIAHDRGEFKMTLEQNQPVDDIPRIDFAPALILRKRSQRGYIRLLNEIEKEIGDTGKVPGGIRELIDPEAAEAARKERIHAECRTQAVFEKTTVVLPIHIAGSTSKELKDNEIYFPLPSNKEQHEIVARLNYGRGVLVQGPPGTGKTHTIANLICHLLAQGKRVLVTSETPRGLQSLQSKFEGTAAPIADLCVLLLGNDAGSLKELEQSVQAINTQLNKFTVEGSNEQITLLHDQLLKVRGEKRKAEQELKSIRESDIYSHNNVYNRYSGTLQVIAQKLRNEQESYSWLEDDIDGGLSANDIFKADSEQFVRSWLAEREHIDLDKVENVIDTKVFPSVGSFSKLVHDYKTQKSTVESMRNTANKKVVDAVENCEPTAIDRLKVELQQILVGMRQLSQHVYPWALQAGKEIVTEQDRRWRELLNMSRAEIDRCEDHVRAVASLQVDGVVDKDVRRLLKCTEILYEYSKDNTKFRRSFFQTKPIKDAFKEVGAVSLDGHKIEDVAALDKFINWLVAKDSINNLKDLWAKLAITSSGALNLQLAEFMDLLEPLELAVNLHNHIISAQREIDAIGQFNAPVWYSIEELEACVRALSLDNEIETLRKLTTCIDAVQSQAELTLADNQELCSIAISAIKVLDTASYQHVLDILRNDNIATNRKIELSEIARILRQKLPNTFKKFNMESKPDVWITRFAQLQPAMDWQGASIWLTRLCDPNVSEEVGIKINAYDKEEKRLLGKLAAQKAWGHCLKRLTEPQRQALIAWLQAITRIGKGSGKYVERHRATARKELKKCQSAIPAWVMPMHRVVENVGPVPEAFDVAIIDEASQSGPEAILLNYIAKKVVVVGDDKQIRPSNIGIDHDEVEHFRKQYLGDVEHSESFGLTSSYFSQAELRFPNYIRLKEHFRCMPEIILFSNNNFYANDPLVPLRQYGGGRLLPVTIAEYVEDGFRVGSGANVHNEPEAKRIVERIAECCADPAYDDKTMGVICLAGGQQDQLIQKLLIEEIESEEIEGRNLLVGRPYAFQGDERDVIFLSMMNAPEGGRRCRVVTGAAKEREFNVAASRAKDQMFLFHSATLNDLSPNCLQYKLLDHCQSPRVEQQEIEGLGIDQIRAAASHIDRKPGYQPPPFDSWFEVDVFLDIVSRGYKVIPQYEVNPFEKTFRIDMVVEGIHGRLAVECDGDQWHGPDRYEHDMARQREIERADWHFWRVRGGVYYFDRDAAMKPLWEVLSNHGVNPSGQEPKNHLAEELIDRKEPSEKSTIETTVLPVDGKDSNPVEENVAGGSPVFELEIQDNTLAQSTKKKKQDITALDLQTAILKVLEERPNRSIATKSLTQAVCKELSIITRGQPRMDLDKRIRRSLGILKRKAIVEEYKAKNVRVRLISI